MAVRHLYSLLVSSLLLVSLPAFAAKPLKDTLNTGIRDYRDEVGFYQKANRDLGDPRFMFSDPKAKVDFGIGGMAKVTTLYGFGGQMSDDVAFAPSKITLPTDHASMYNMSIGGTEVHFKARTYIGEHKLGAFVKLSGKFDKSVEVDQAYISYDNFSIGLIPSFFMDLEVGVMTTGVGFGTQVDVTHPLIGYTWRLDDRWSIAAAMEWPELNLDHYSPEMGIGSDYQPVPDLVAHMKFRWDKGHIQVGAVMRHLNYWVFDYPVEYDTDGESRMVSGYGFSLSGNYRPVDKLKLSWEFTSGAGNATYMNNFSDLHLDLGLKENIHEGYPVMAAIPVTSDQVAAQYDFSDSFSSSVVLGYTYCAKQRGVVNFNPFRESFSAVANFFWNIDEYSYLGLEYLYGNRRIYAPEGEPSFGRAHRIACVLAYCF